MIFLLLWFVAPILQIILSVLRINGRIALPIGPIGFCAFIVGVVCTIIVADSQLKALSKHPPVRCMDCGMVPFAIVFAGFFITILSTTVIGLISYLIYYFKIRSKTKERV